MAEYEAEVLPGLAPFALHELRGTPGVQAETPHGDPERVEAVPFRHTGDVAALHGLRTVTAVHRRIRFEVPRPRALLGDAHHRRLLRELGEVLASAPAPMHGFRFRAAGRDSPAFQRLAGALEAGLGLAHDDAAGELQLRVRRDEAGGWEVLARLTPRPLSARTWRVRNRSGGLNACVAAAAVSLLGAPAQQRYLNAMCGSGTLLIERAHAGPAARLVGVDLAEEALNDAEANLTAAGVKAELRREDARALPEPDGAFDAVVADLPWGDAVGGHRHNEELYPAFLREARRLVAPRGRALLISHELRLMERLLERDDRWALRDRRRVYHGGHRPALLVLEPR